MNKYTLSKTSIIGIAVLILGFVFTMQGIFIRYRLSNVKESYQQTEIKKGCFIERDITREQLIDNDSTFHIFGKFEKFDSILPYDPIAECPGIDNPTGTNQMMSSRYQIKMIDPFSEKKVLYKGLSLFIFGSLILLVTMKIEKVTDD